MKMKRFEIEQYYEVPECECGGIFSKTANNFVYTSNPPQADYRCSKCGKIVRLYSEDWPGIRSEIKGLHEQT